MPQKKAQEFMILKILIGAYESGMQQEGYDIVVNFELEIFEKFWILLKAKMGINKGLFDTF